MPLKIVAKANTTQENNQKTKALITILGIQGGYLTPQKEVKFSNFTHKANYYFEGESLQKEYFNTLPLLLEKYPSYEIIPIFTEDAKIFNQKVLEEGYPHLSLSFDENYFIQDEKDFKGFFHLIEEAIASFDEVIVDVSHGFRHLPILMIVELIIQNFQDSQKVQKILFAKEIQKHDPIQKGLYEIIDLKEYLDLANITFILSTFEKNYTVANHISSTKYANLIDKLNDFSNDMMALHIGNLPVSTKQLIQELSKIDDISIQNQAKKLEEKITTLTNFQGKKRYQTYLNLAKDLFEKNYMLLSLALLFESVRFYIRTTIKRKNQKIVETIEKEQNDDYKLNQFFKSLKTKSYEKNSRGFTLSSKEYYQLQNSFPSGAKSLYDKIDIKRNNLAHANAKVSFKDIKNDIKSLFDEYETLIKK